MNESEQEVKTVKYTCKKCLKPIEFTVNISDIDTEDFPIELSNKHGDPQHKLTITVDSSLKVVSFEIDESLDGDQGRTTKFTEKVLKQYGLSDKEIEVHKSCFGLGQVTAGEIARMAKISVSEAEEIADKFVEKGFFREIIGAKHYYQALPPYPALIDQLETFGNFLAEIKEQTPKDLQESFKSFENQASGVQKLNEFVEYLNHLNETVQNKISDDREKLDENIKSLDQSESIEALQTFQQKTEGLLETQLGAVNSKIMGALSEFDNRFADLEKQLDRSVQVFDERIDVLAERFERLKRKLTNSFAKLRLGVIQNVVEEVLHKTFLEEIRDIKTNFKASLLGEFRALTENLKKTFIEEMKDPIVEILNSSAESFHSDFREPFEILVKTVADQIQVSITAAAQSGDSLKETFSSIMAEFDRTINEAQGRISGISEKVLESFKGLRDRFSSTVIQKLNNTLDQVQGKLDLSSKTVEEFWEDSKEIITQTTKDVWFVRTPEAISAQINNAIINAKMRILIVAPSLSEIELDPIMKAKNHINIRISCKIDPEDEVHKEILELLEDKHNVTLRDRDTQNLWGINRDYEEVILGIISQESLKSDRLDLVGIGSYLQEHIKILVPVLEEAWMGSRKDFMKSPEDDKVKGKQNTFTRSTVSGPKPSQVNKSRGAQSSAARSQAVSSKPGSSASQAPTSSASASQGVVKQNEPSGPVPGSPTEPKKDDKVDPAVIESIMKKIDEIEAGLDSLSGQEMSEKLKGLRDYIFENKGFSIVLNDIKNWASQVRQKGVIDENTRKMLKKRIANWKEKI